MRALLVGSGQSARDIVAMDLEGAIVCAIHSAWKVCPRLDYHIVSGDWIPPEGYRVPQGFYAGCKKISYKEYDGERQRARYGRQALGIGATMFFNAAYWMLGNLPELTEIGFLGCSMNYPEGESNTFYGSGKSDPLRFGLERLSQWFRLLEKHATRQGIKLINYGEEGLMPYRRLSPAAPSKPPNPAPGLAQPS